MYVCMYVCMYGSTHGCEWMDRASRWQPTCGCVQPIPALSCAPLHVLPEFAHLLLQVGADLRARAPLRRHSALEGLDVDLEAVQAVLGVVLQPSQLVLHPAARLTAAVSERLDLRDDAVEVFPAVAGQGFDLTHVVAQVHHLQSVRSCHLNIFPIC